MRFNLLIIIMFAASACAAPGEVPEHNATSEHIPEATSDKIDSDIDVAQEVMHDTSTEVQGTEVQSVAVPAPITIEDIESPTVAETPAELIPGRPTPETAIVCEQTRRPGSVLPVQVCRDKVDIELRRAADQELFDDIKRNTALFTSRL